MRITRYDWVVRCIRSEFACSDDFVRARLENCSALPNKLDLDDDDDDVGLVAFLPCSSSPFLLLSGCFTQVGEWFLN